MKQNQNYKYLLDNGFNIDIRSNAGGYSVMYLVQNGKRLNDKKVYFKDNKQNRDTLIEKAFEARDFTHLGCALHELKIIAHELMEKVWIEDLPRSLRPEETEQ